MCGRYSLVTDTRGQVFKVVFRGSGISHEPRYNIAPTQQVLTVVNDEGENQAWQMRWGLIPFWAKDAKIGNKMINARSETLAETKVFKPLLEKRRCLILADGFYEWFREGKQKTPMRIVLKTGEPFAFAGLWSRWKSPEGESVHSCTIITTQPNGLVEPIHDRMPVILSPESAPIWLDPGIDDPSRLSQLLTPYPSDEMEAYAVLDAVNSSRSDTPECIQARM